jgi:hypothetical protein
MHDKTDCLTDWCCGSVGENHEPWTERFAGELNCGDATAKGETFEGLVEADSDKKDYKGGTGSDGDGHTDEDTVKENTSLKQKALQ